MGKIENKINPSKVYWNSEKEKREMEVKAARLGMSASEFLVYRASQPITKEELERFGV